jgi:5,5'-dehydrodivanillate O-demethylase
MDEQGQFTNLDVTFNQDYMCWITQGDIARRHLEKLGESDRGIILFRKMLLEQAHLVGAGQEPTMNIFRDHAENEGLDFPMIPNEGGEWVGAPRGGNFTYHPQEAGYSRDADKIEATMATWKDRADLLK